MLPLECTHPAGTLRAGSAEIRRAPPPEYRPKQGKISVAIFENADGEMQARPLPTAADFFAPTEGASGEVP